MEQIKMKNQIEILKIADKIIFNTNEIDMDKEEYQKFISLKVEAIEWKKQM